MEIYEFEKAQELADEAGWDPLMSVIHRQLTLRRARNGTQEWDPEQLDITAGKLSLNKCREEVNYLRAENRELWRELENRLLGGFQTSDGGWELNCLVCGVRGSDRHLMQHGPDCPFIVIPELVRTHGIR